MEIREYLQENYPESLLADGFDSCIVGVSSKGNVVYDTNKIISTLMTGTKETKGMTREVALEHFHFNIECAYVGDYTPIYMDLKEDLIL